MVKRACVVTATRAEYGLLRPLMQEFKNSADYQLQLVVSGTHLSPEFGLTWQAIESDGFEIDEQIDMLLSGDTACAAAKSLGLMCIGLADALRRLKPDFIVVLGDRYETVGVASTAMLFNIPVVHLYGGEITKGAVDDAYRHAITKLSHLHFTSTEEYRQRVIQMGENCAHVFNTGAIGVDNIRTLSLLSRDELAKSLGIDLTESYFVVTYHPATAVESDAVAEIDALIMALLSVENTQVVITLSNADVGGRSINQHIQQWVARYPDRLHAFASLGQLRYLSAIRHSLGVIGNSSSGIVEAPSLQVGTLNIGARQEGRIQAASVLNCATDELSIRDGLRKLASAPFQAGLVSIQNPYGDGYSVGRMMAVLRDVDFKRLVKKDFFDLA